MSVGSEEVRALAYVPRKERLSVRIVSKGIGIGRHLWLRLWRSGKSAQRLKTV